MQPIILFMLTINPGKEFLLTVVISLLGVVWLCACAFFDRRTHQVPNGLTLPAIPAALLCAWLTRESHPESIFRSALHLAILTLPLLVAWSKHLIGGADLKILLVLSLINPLLIIAAWAGVVLYFLGVVLLNHRRPRRFAGVPGFALGTGLFTLAQMALLFSSHLTA